MKVSLRPLEERDASASVAWRNDPYVWRYTGKRPDREITLQMEQEWIKKVLARPNEERFAICVGEGEEYVGNVQLTDITSDKAQFHIFIGKREYHGKGIGTQATQLMIKHAFLSLKLKIVYLRVQRNNIAAVKSYEKCGFKIVETTDSEFVMKVENDDSAPITGSLGGSVRSLV